MRIDLKEDVVSLTDFARDAEEHRMDLRLRAALESHAKGERGQPMEAAMTGIRQRAAKSRPAR